ncbi:MAG: hypothetical protein QXT13_10980 [Pyrobaculum sp.]
MADIEIEFKGIYILIHHIELNHISLRYEATVQKLSLKLIWECAVEKMHFMKRLRYATYWRHCAHA